MVSVFKISWDDPYGHEVGRKRIVAMWRKIARPTSCPYRHTNEL